MAKVFPCLFQMGKTNNDNYTRNNDNTFHQFNSSADPEGGTGVLYPPPPPPPPGKSQVIWVSIGNKQLDPIWKKLDPLWKLLDPLWNLET